MGFNISDLVNSNRHFRICANIDSIFGLCEWLTGKDLPSFDFNLEASSMYGISTPCMYVQSLLLEDDSYPGSLKTTLSNGKLEHITPLHFAPRLKLGHFSKRIRMPRQTGADHGIMDVPQACSPGDFL